MRFFAFLVASLIGLVPANAGHPVFSRQRVICDHSVAAVRVYEPVQIQPLVVYSPLVAPASYYSVGEEYRTKNIVAAVIQELQTGRTVLQPPQAVTTPPAWQTTPLPQKVVTEQPCEGHTCSHCGKSAPTPQTPPVQPETPPAADTELDKQVLAVFSNTSGGQKSCVSCHGGGASDKPAANFRLVYPAADGSLRLNKSLTKEQRAQVALYSDKGLMPPSVLADPSNPKNAHAVSNDGVRILTEWSLTK